MLSNSSVRPHPRLRVTAWGIPIDRELVSGGFATVQPNSTMSINATEGYPLEDFSADAIRAQIAEAQKIASGSGSEQDIAEAKIELEVSAIAALKCDSAANQLVIGSGDSGCPCQINVPCNRSDVVLVHQTFLPVLPTITLPYAEAYDRRSGTMNTYSFCFKYLLNRTFPVQFLKVPSRLLVKGMYGAAACFEAWFLPSH